MAAGQCKVDPPTGLAGAFFSNYTGDLDGLVISAALVSGSTSRKQLGALLEGLASALYGSAGFAVAISSKAANFNASTGTHYRCDTSGGGFTATLPDPATVDVGASITIKKVSADGNTLTIATVAGTIDGVATVLITLQWAAVTVRNTGAVWDIY